MRNRIVLFKWFVIDAFEQSLKFINFAEMSLKKGAVESMKSICRGNKYASASKNSGTS